MRIPTVFFLAFYTLPLFGQAIQVPVDASNTFFVESAKNPDAAAALQAALKVSPDDPDIHRRLLGYYWVRSYYFQQTDLRHAMVAEEDWFAVHEPQSNVFDATDFYLQKSDFLAPHESELAIYKEHWKTAVAQHPDDPLVLQHAVRALQGVDAGIPVLALSHLRVLMPTTPQYALVLAGLFSAIISIQLQQNSGASSVYALLLKSDDPAVVGLTGQILFAQARAAGKPDEIGAALLRKAHEIDPTNRRWPAALEAPPPASPGEAMIALNNLRQEDLWIGGKVHGMVLPPDAVKVGPSVQAARLISPNPASLANALTSNLGPGSIRLFALIGPDGRMQQVEFVFGSVKHMAYATRMLKIWLYKPTLVDGRPVPVSTYIDLNFTSPAPSRAPSIGGALGGVMGGAVGGVLGSSGKRPPSGAQATKPILDPALKTAPSSVIQVSPDFLQSLSRPHPPIPYPDAANGTHELGSVNLKILVSKNGGVQEVVILSGPAHLSQAAADAVKTWKYIPYIVDDKPREVQSTLSVSFFGEHTDALLSP